jgi:hypothetical protein
VTIEKLEALERAATAGPWMREPIYWAFRMAEKGGSTHVPENLPEGTEYPTRDDACFIAEARNAIPSLLAVAKAAKAYCVLSHAGADTHDAYLELWEALAQLEATP